MSKAAQQVTQDIDFFYEKKGATLTINYAEGKTRALIHSSGSGGMSFDKANDLAQNIIWLTEFGQSMVALIEGHKMKDIVASHVFYNDDYEFLPIDGDVRGWWGFDTKSRGVKYFPYGELFNDFERRLITNELDLC